MPPPTADLGKLAVKLGTEGPVKILPTPRLVQLLHNGVYIARTTNASFVWEHPFYPQLYLPKAAFPSASLSEGKKYTSPDGKTTYATQLLITAGNATINETLCFSPHLAGPAAALANLVKINFAAVDQWFEESTPIFVHPKDPFKRIDILSSTRHLVVKVGGQKVAETNYAMHLYETGLPVRYYIPLTAIDAGVLRRSETRTACPYKGWAEYYSVVVDGETHEDVVWYYNAPLLESASIVGLCCFYNEKVHIELDGEVQETPVTHFSKAGPKDLGPPSAV